MLQKYKMTLLVLKARLRKLAGAGAAADVAGWMGFDSLAQLLKVTAMVALLLLAVVDVLLAVLAKMLKAAFRLAIRYAAKVMLAFGVVLLVAVCLTVEKPSDISLNTYQFA